MSISNKTTRLHELYYARCPVPTPLAIAMQLGWVDEAMYQLAGIEVKSLFESINPADLPQHFEINHTNAFRQGGSIPMIWARANQQETRVIGLTWTDEYQALIGLPHSGISNVKELRGRRIGLPKHVIAIDHSRASALRGFVVLLETEGLTLKDVEIVDLLDHEIPSMVRDGKVIATGTGRRGRYCYSSEIHALSNNLVDAVYVKDVRGAQATHLLGAHVIADINRHPDPYVRINHGTPRPLTVNVWLLENYPHLVDCLIQRIYNAGEWAAQNPVGTIALLSQEIGWAENWVHYAYGENIHRSLRLDLRQENIDRLGALKNFLLEHKFIQQDFSIESWIDPRPMQRLLNANKRQTPSQRKILSNLLRE
jgi:ABC-type nitrate/sulfonate/bicarbonate transport system substrate-binding protein